MGDFADALNSERQLKAERRAWREERKELEAELARVRSLLDVATGADERRGRRIDWSRRRRSGPGHRAIVTAILSDLHFDEIVRAQEMNGVNAYDRRIAEQRLKRWTQKACSLPVDHLPNYSYDGAAIFLAGDILSGDIHEELRRTNADTVCGSIAYWLDPLHAAIAAVADTYGKVTVDVVAGNHGRNPLDRRSPAKGRARDNFDTLMGWLLARDFAADDRVDVVVSESPDALRQVYATRYLITHGDQARGGSGISGALAPLMLFTHRKGKRQSAVGQPYDVMCIGHWHTYMHLAGQGLIVNGSLKGMDEYAMVSNFAFEPPQQAMWLTTPEHGVTVAIPIHVQDRRQEGW